MTNLGMCYVYKLYAFLAYMVPMLSLYIVNVDHYYTEGTYWGFFSYIILAFVIISFKNSFINAFKTKTLITTSAVLLVFSLIMRYISDEMILICAVSLVGSIIQNFFEVVADVYYNYSYIVQDGIKKRNRAHALPQKEAWREAYGFSE